MSNIEQGITAVVGGIIGFVIGGPTGAAYGFQLGLIAGTALFPTQLPPVVGPRLEDLQTTTAQLGSPVPITYGTIAVPGTVMWLDCPREVSTTEEVGGKGGGPEQEVTTYTYFQSIALGLCEGPIDGVLRIWENGELKYDVREIQDGETYDQYTARLESSAEYAVGFTLYLGDEEQEADPTIESVQGEGNVPAFRGLAYIVYPNRQLRDDQARRHPQFKFEVYHGALSERSVTMPTLLDDTAFTSFDRGRLVPDWDNNRFFTFDVLGTGAQQGVRVHTLQTNTEVLERTFEDLFGTIDDPTAVWSATVGPEGDLYFPIDYGNGDNVIVRLNSDLEIVAQGPDDGFSGQWNSAIGIRAVGAGRTEDYILAASFISGIFSVYQCSTLAFVHVNSSGYERAFVCGSYTETSESGLSSITYAFGIAADEVSSGTTDGVHIYQFSIELGIDLLTGEPLTHIASDEVSVLEPSDIDAGWTRIQFIGSLMFDQSDRTLIFFVVGGGTASSPDDEYLIKVDPSTGEILWKIEGLSIIHDESNNHARLHGERFAYVNPVTLDSSIIVVDTEAGTYEEQDWSGDTEQSFITSGVTHYDSATNCLLTFMDDTGPVRVCLGAIEPSPVSLATIASDVSERCRLTSEDINVTDLGDVYVYGYAIGRTTPGRQALEPLRPIGAWDAVESQGVLKFIRRGGSVVATLTTADLGAHETGSDASPAITTRKAQDVELPQQIRVHYTAHTRDYEPGEQLSPNRLNTDAVNVVDVEIPAALLSDEQAAQVAEIAWADAWKARWSHQIALDSAFLWLDPADPIIVPVDGRAQRMRIVSIEDSSGGLLRRMDLVRDDDGSYVSYAVADGPQRPSTGIVIYSATGLVLLDLPPLRDEDDNAGIYAAVYRETAGRTWNGAVIYRSADSEATWGQIATVVNEAAVGAIVDALPNGISTTWDDANELEVELYGDATLESRTPDDVLEGANAAAIGAHGRWEIIQFCEVEQISTRRWRLSKLLRGRRATEHHLGTSEDGDTFVLLSGSGVIHLTLQTSEIGLERYYRAVSIGTTFSSAESQAFTGEGEALEPFSPVHIRGTRDASGNLTITWTRRGRIGQELRSGADIPLSEESEEYEVDVLETGSPDAVTRTLESTTTSVTYTAAQQITDSGSTQSSVRVRVYQLSAVVGRGTPGEATI